MRWLIPGVLALAVAACSGTTTPTAPSNPAPIPASAACAALGATPGLAILSGEQCGVATGPVVKINLKGPGGAQVGTCTGTLIAPRAVLTAAHCLDEGVVTAQIWFGVIGTPEIVGSAIHYYPGYTFPGSFDVGVILFAEDIGRTPASILTSRRAVVGEIAILAGWGRDEASDTRQLRAGSTRISGVDEKNVRTVYGPPSASVCSGDSGGPIFVSEGGRWVVAGITSATTSAACSTGENIYQAVENINVRNFIRQYVPTVGER